MNEQEPYTFNIDIHSELVDDIVAAWLLRHIGFAVDRLSQSVTDSEDWLEAEKDLKAMHDVFRKTGSRMPKEYDDAVAMMKAAAREAEKRIHISDEEYLSKKRDKTSDTTQTD